MKNGTLVFGIFLLLLMGCSGSKTFNNKAQPVQNSVLAFGADMEGKTDSSEAFTKALSSAYPMIIVPAGTYIVDATVKLEKHLRLEAGVNIIRTKKGSDDPIFWLSKSYASLEGGNKKVEIISHKALKDGIIKIGHESAQAKGINILNTEVKNLTVTGPRSVKEKGTVGIHFYNAQNRGDGMTTSYFHTLDNLVIQHTSFGVVLEGLSNANSISRILFNRVGNTEQEAAIVLLGSMENRIYDIFHHYSKNATTIIMDDYLDSKGSRIVPTYNYIFGVVAEQGGQNAICADIRSGQYNQIGVLCNTGKGNKYFEQFEMKKNKRLID